MRELEFQAADWEETSLGDICTFRGGNGFKEEYQGQLSGEFPFIKVSDLTLPGNEKYITDAQNWVSQKTLKMLRANLQPEGAVVFAKVGAALKLNRRRILTRPTVIDNNMMAAIPDESRVDTYFLYYFMLTQDLGRFSQESAVPSVNQGHLSSIEIGLPELPEQRKIAEILRTWDEAIEKLEALRAAKLRRHRALTHSLVFGTRQLDRFRTTDEVAAHRWFTLPATWGTKPIGKLAREISERNGDGEQHEVLSCSKYDGFVRSLEYFKKQVFSADLSGYKKIWRGDFGFPSNHVEEGSIGLQNLTDVGVVSPIYTVFRFAPEKVDADYAFAVLKTGLYRHIFEVSTSASVDRRGSLRWSEFSKLPFPLPSLAEQRAIAEVLRTAQTDLDALNTEIEALTRQKRGLMQKLLTGEWRVAV
ncbi:restriction endonuclease subunit S [Falsochrobactrum sp. TDYN1]|uniref:Restriction endonuclease subunit S n=1 Tax=Falsochrobactrum tianjinense TaxID=2706015 RepID=A0A949PRE6_9HYPH|nr:restriction endonuclease subunit S [Falsochrobactrum sp. TDYN1]MBV2144879.1 restriction endonuclease subunit S [Falsochrobactrum sp. TDYN1]